MSDTGGDGVVSAGDVKVRPDARVYRMRLKQVAPPAPGRKSGKEIPYYADSGSLGLVGIGFRAWYGQKFLSQLDISLREKLARAARDGMQRSYPTEKPNTFTDDRIAVLDFEGLTDGEAEQVHQAWNDDPPDENGADSVPVFLTARPGDLIIAGPSPEEKYHFGVFAERASNIEHKSATELMPLGRGGHICRPVTWRGRGVPETRVLEWLNQTGLKDTSHMITALAPRATIEAAMPGRKKGTSLNFLKQKNDHKSASLRSGEQGSSQRIRRNPIQTILHRAKTVILEGVPGTGKTWAIKNQICNTWLGQPLKGQGNGHYAITLHPATTYEDFVEGLRPTTAHIAVTSDQLPGPSAVSDARSVRHHGETINGVDLVAHRYFHVRLPDIHEANTGDTGPSFAMQDGFFLRVCAEATHYPKKDYVVLLDEINRCNVPKVMGDLLTTLERSKRALWNDKDEFWDLSPCQVVTLPGSKRLFFVPSNVYVVATMNSTDRSVAPLDAALRRRFAFHRCWPKGFDTAEMNVDKVEDIKTSEIVAKFKEDRGDALERAGTWETFQRTVVAWSEINHLLFKQEGGGPDALLGHSYLMDLADDLCEGAADADAWVTHHWNHHLLPQLADVLLTHNLEGLAAGGGELLKIAVGGRAFVNETSIVKRGQGALILRLEEGSAISANLTNATESPQHDWLNESKIKDLIQFFPAGFDSDADECGIWVHSSNGPKNWGTQVTNAINVLVDSLNDSMLLPVRFWRAPKKKKGELVFELTSLDGEARKNCSSALMKLNKKPFACSFKRSAAEQVGTLCDSMRKAALTP